MKKSLPLLALALVLFMGSCSNEPKTTTLQDAAFKVAVMKSPTMTVIDETPATAIENGTKLTVVANSFGAADLAVGDYLFDKTTDATTGVYKFNGDTVTIKLDELETPISAIVTTDGATSDVTDVVAELT